MAEWAGCCVGGGESTVQAGDGQERDVEDLWQMKHAEACQAGESHYIDPLSGYRVFTEVGLRKRGRCCGCACRHCPYHHANVDPAKRAEKVKNASLLYGSLEPLHKVDLLFWSGGKDSFLALRALCREQQAETRAPGSKALRGIVLMTTFEVNTRQVAHQEVHINEIVRQAASLDLPLVGVPMHSRSSSSYTERIQAGVKLVADSCGILRFCFGDLHLEHIRQWREDNLTGPAEAVGASLHYPIWKVPYPDLTEDLGQSRVPCVLSAVTLEAENTPCQEGQRIPDVGDLYTSDLVERLPDGVDAFGECGEFHTLAQVWEAKSTALPAAEAVV